jgi:outer membrane protein assembly factor BamB
MRAITAAMMTLILCSACASTPWFKFGSDYANNGISLPSTAKGTIAWKFFSGLEIQGGAVLDSASNVYFTSTNGSAYAFTKDGAQIWRFSLEKPVSMRTTPAVENGRVFLGADDGQVFAVDQKYGILLWFFKTGGPVVASIAPSGDVIYAASEDHKLYCLNAATGKKLWDFKAGDKIDSSPAQAPGGELYFGANDGKLYALDVATGKQLWSRTTGGTINAAPAVGINDSVFVGSDDGIFHAFDSQGNELWQFNGGNVDGSVWWSPAAVIFVGGPQNRQIVYIADNAVVAALDSAAGAVLWRNPPWFTGGLGAYVSQPAVVPNGALYIGNTSQSGGALLFSVDSKTGNLQWSSLLGGSILNTPAVGLDGKIYVTSEDGTLYVVN